MKKLVLKFTLLLLLSFGNANALEESPDITFLSNQFHDLQAIGNYVVALSPHGISTFRWDSTQTKLEEVDNLTFASPPKTMINTSDGIVVRHENNQLSFLQVGFSSNIEIRGQVTPPDDYFDFEVIWPYLLVSRWFDGIDQYEIQEFNKLSFVKNDKSGTVVTQLASRGNFLYALDLYNGIILYDLDVEFGTVQSELLLNRRALSFGVVGTSVYISGNDSSILVGEFNKDSASVVATITGVQGVREVEGGSGYVALISERDVFVVDARDSFKVVGFRELYDEKPFGDLDLLDEGRCLILPRVSGGISLANVNDLDGVRDVIVRRGPIKSVVVHDKVLFTGGDNNPLEAFQFENGNIISPAQLRGDAVGLSDATIDGNNLYALYSREKLIVKFDISNMNSILAVDSFSVSISNAQKILVHDGLLLAISRFQIESIMDGNSVAVLNTPDPTVDVALLNNYLYVTNSFGSIDSYQLNADYTFTECAHRDLTGTGWAMTIFDNKLFVFTGNTLTSFTVCLVLDTIVHLPYFVLDATINNDTLYTVGPDGIAKYDLSSGLPEFVESGGIGGSIISTDGHTIATTDGSSINLYFENSGENRYPEVDEPPIKTVLFDNYPEPFNSSTTIQFEIESTSTVELSIYNLLGRKVRTVTNQSYLPGRHIVSWNGKDDAGAFTASGIYFYRLVVGEEVLTKKMMLIK